jgi:hypothetical protein
VVDETTQLFGDPVAVVRDMSKACAKAVTSLTERGVPDFVCHYHFVADIGRDLMRRDHEGVNGALAIHGISHALRDLLSTLKTASGDSQQGREAKQLAAVVYWVLNGPGHKTPRFPFGLPHLEYYNRVRSAAEVTRQWVSKPWSKQLKKWVRTLEDIARRLDGDKELEQTLQELALGKELFDELRRLLRLEADPTNEQQPLLPEADVHLRRTIHTELDNFLRRLERLAPPRQEYQDRSLYHTVLDHITKHRRHLFGHPVIRDGTGEAICVVDRTNNPLETLFAKNKQALRRRTGRKYLSRDLEDLPAQVTLVENLRHPDYVRVVCGSLDNLPEALARVARGTSPANLRPRPDIALQRQVRRLCLAHSGRSASLQMAAEGATGS